MLLEQIALYGAALFIIIKVFLLVRKKYKNHTIFTKKDTKEEHKQEDRKNDKLYEKNKQKEFQQTLQQKIHNDIEKDNIKEIYKEDIDIVGIAKPVGKWTEMVMRNGNLMLRFAQLIRSEGGQKGFWELFIKAQASTQGKHKGKGR